MIQEVTEFIAGRTSLTLGENLFSRGFYTELSEGVAITEGRFSDVRVDPAELSMVELIVLGRANSPLSAETFTKTVVDSLRNKANVPVPGLTTRATFTVSVPRRRPDLDAESKTVYAAEVVIVYK